MNGITQTRAPVAEAEMFGAKVAEKTKRQDPLRVAAKIWFVVSVIGQWMFAAYVVVAYGRPAAQGALEGWNSINPNTYNAAEPMHTAALAIHLILAVIIIGGGPLQLIPAVRNKFPKFHRINGRLYMLTVLLTCIAGTYLIWVKPNPGGTALAVGATVNAALNFIFIFQAVRYAIKGNIAAHNRWALRMFIAVLAPWFYRIMIMDWFLLVGPVGIDPETFAGPTLVAMAFGQYLIPLFFLEIYLRIPTSATRRTKWVAAGGVGVLTLLTALGTFAATAGMWLPKM